jgi:hypothetical protein
VSGDASGDDRTAPVSDRRAWTTVLVVLGLLALFIVVGLFILRSELRGCFGGCGANGCDLGCSVSNAPGS